jgi:predicted NAD/FAD-binding protein
MVDKLRVAIIGAGISGLSCAYALRKESSLEITLFEKASYIGGHSNTIPFTPKGSSQSFPIDTGFLVFNEWTYPGLIAFFKELDVPVAKSEMSFSVSLKKKNGRRLEWAGNNLSTLFAQGQNLLSPSFLRMLFDIVRFNQAGKKMCQTGVDHPSDLKQLESVGEFLARKKFSAPFRDWYLLPMIGAIWSCSLADMMHFPIQTLMQFCNNHGLLNIVRRPQWMTVAGGSKEYVRRTTQSLQEHDVRIEMTKVSTCSRVSNAGNDPITIELITGEKRAFDKVVFACHTDEVLEILNSPSSDEKAILGAIGYKQNTAYVHEDRQLLPIIEDVWAAWNYTCEDLYASGIDQSPAVCVHYLINKLQPLPEQDSHVPVIVSLNPQIKPAPDKVHQCIEYSHPILNQDAILAQKKLPKIQGVNNSYFCGAWTRYGFHEDGFQSGLNAANTLMDSISAI